MAETYVQGDIQLEGTEAIAQLKELTDRLTELGYQVDVPLKDKFAKHLELMKQIKDEWGGFGKLPKEIAASVAQMSQELEKAGLNAKSVSEKVFSGIHENFSSVVKKSRDTVTNGLKDVIPSELKTLGIWGLLIGTAAFTISKFNEVGAAVLEGWGRTFSGIRNMSDVQLKATENVVGQEARRISEEFGNVVSVRDVGKIMNSMAFVSGGFEGFGQKMKSEFRSMTEETMELSQAFGKDFSAIADSGREVAMLLSPVGAGKATFAGSFKGFVGDMSELYNISSKWKVDLGVVYNLFGDIRTRAGDLELATKSIVDTMGVFIEKGVKGGMPLEQIAKGLPGLIPSMTTGMPEGFQWMEAMQMFPGMSPQDAYFQYKQLMSLGAAYSRTPGGKEIGQAGFEKMMYGGYAGVLGHIGGIGSMSQGTLYQVLLNTMKMPDATARMLSSLQGQLQAEGKGQNIETLLKDIAEGKSVHVSSAVAKSLDAFKRLTEDKVPAWERALKAIVAIITDILTGILQAVSGIALWVYGYTQKGTYNKKGEDIGKLIEKQARQLIVGSGTGMVAGIKSNVAALKEAGYSMFPEVAIMATALQQAYKTAGLGGEKKTSAADITPELTGAGTTMTQEVVGTAVSEEGVHLTLKVMIPHEAVAASNKYNKKAIEGQKK